MARNQVDLIDLGNYFVYFIFSFLSFEWMNWQLPILNTDLNFALLTFSSPTQEVAITFPRLALIASLVYLLWTNDLNWDAYSAFQIFAVFALVWMIISPPFVPIMYVLVQDVAISSIIAFFIQSIGYAVVMYMG